MTVLGATLYAGFFGLAALWLVATAPEADDRVQAQRQVRSNSSRAAAGPLGSSPCCATQVSQK